MLTKKDQIQGDRRDIFVKPLVMLTMAMGVAGVTGMFYTLILTLMRLATTKTGYPHIFFNGLLHETLFVIISAISAFSIFFLYLWDES